MNASCLSFVTAFHAAACMLKVGTYRRIAIVAPDLASRGVDWDEPETSLIFSFQAQRLLSRKTQRTFISPTPAWGHGSSAVRDTRAASSEANVRAT
ncbi:hypothetical protein [Dyella sp.]|uniref:hypothetical protein n=1 Tax=Dyella sp. TaxID=1869338 RepID=UPI0039C89AD5